MFPVVHVYIPAMFNLIFLLHKTTEQIFKFNMFYMNILWVLSQKYGDLNDTKYEISETVDLVVYKNNSPFSVSYVLFEFRSI